MKNIKNICVQTVAVASGFSFYFATQHTEQSSATAAFWTYGKKYTP
ncbi:MAG: hypothetical protein ACI825_001982 [Planctomycetota bacterium]|jgi:hypothetical protein